MHRRLHRIAAALMLAPAMAGCMQMTRHSNMVVFGTNTSVGVRVGQSATSVPEIQLGFARQEAVVMPLVANTRSRRADGDRRGTQGRGGEFDDLLEPCDLTQPVTVTGGARFAVHPCSLVAVNGSALDSYSVLASFGARFSASGSADGADASVGLAQYFATGMAAQMLAVNGGAAVVAVSQAAEESSRHPVSEAAIQQYFGNAAAFQSGQALALPYLAFEARLVGLIDALATDGDAATKIANFELNAGIPAAISLRTTCTTRDLCRQAILGDHYGQIYVTRGAAMTSALERW